MNYIKYSLWYALKIGWNPTLTKVSHIQIRVKVRPASFTYIKPAKHPKHLDRSLTCNITCKLLQLIYFIFRASHRNLKML